MAMLRRVMRSVSSLLSSVIIMTVAIGLVDSDGLVVMDGRFTADSWLFIEVIFFDGEIIAANNTRRIAHHLGKAWHT